MHKAGAQRHLPFLIAVCRSNTPARVATMYSPVLYPMYARRARRSVDQLRSAYSTVKDNAGYG